MQNHHGYHERSRSYSGGWNSSSRPTRHPQIATVLPVSKSFSEDDLLKATIERSDVPRVFSRLKIQNLSLLKKDSLIGELEKCLEELEDKHDTTQQLADVYEKVECERNELLDELDIAFQDLQEYMKRQKTAEDDKSAVEAEREDLVRENEYLKTVLSNRQVIEETKLQEQNRVFRERVKELEHKNNEYVDEITNLQEERQTLISSLVNLRSEDVNNVISRKSRTSSVSSLVSLGDDFHSMDDTLSLQVDELQEQLEKGNVDSQGFKKVVEIYKADNEDLKRSLVRVKRERDEAEREIDEIKEECDLSKNSLAAKNKEYNKLKEERDEKKLNLSKVNVEKRTLQRQVDHLREANRSSTVKMAILKKEFDDMLNKKELKTKNDATSNGAVSITDLEEKLKMAEKNHNKQIVAKENIIEEMKLKQLNNENEIKTFKLSEKSMLEEKEDREKQVKREKLKSQGDYITISEKFEKKVSEYNALKDCVEIHEQEYKMLKESLDHLNKQHSLSQKQLNNRVSVLEIENTKLKASKEVLEKLLLTSEEDYSKLYDVKESLEDALKEKDNHVTAEREENSLAKNELKDLQNEYEVLLLKSKEFERNVGKMSQLFEDNKRIKSSYERLLEANKNIEIQNNALLKTKENEREKYSSLLVKYDQLSKEHNTLCEECTCKKQNNKDNDYQFKDLLSANEKLQRDFDAIQSENEKLSAAYDNLCRDTKNIQTNYDELLKENKKVVELNYTLQKEKKSDGESSVTLQVSKNTDKLQNQVKELEEKLSACEITNLKTEKDYQYILKSHREEAIANLDIKQTEIEQERHTVKVKYELLRVEHEKLKKENDQANLTVETLRQANEKLNVQIQKLRLCSNSTHDATIRQLRDDNETLDRKYEALQSTIGSLTTEKNTLVERIHRSDESVTTTIRSLKARKSELQIQVESLKHENQMLKTSSATLTKDEDDVHKECKSNNMEYMDKLKESEQLLHDLQQALAKANDLAMQKALEGTKIKRNLEKKMDKLYQENIELRRKKPYRSSQSADFINSNSSVASVSPTNNSKPATANLTLNLDNSESCFRKKSFPLSSLSMTNVRVTSPTSPLSSVSSQFEKQTRSKSVPHSPRLQNSPTTQVSLNELHRVSSSEFSDISDSPKLAASRQVEYDLSQQLKELLELTDDLTSGKMSDGNKVSTATLPTLPPPPPVPPLPNNYNALEKKKSIERRISIKQQQQQNPPKQQPKNNIEEKLKKEKDILNVSIGSEHWV